MVFRQGIYLTNLVYQFTIISNASYARPSRPQLDGRSIIKFIKISDHDLDAISIKVNKPYD
jgi:hypothetical protein